MTILENIDLDFVPIFPKNLMPTGQYELNAKDLHTWPITYLFVLSYNI